MKLSPARVRMLRRLADVTPGNAFLCGGHQRTACAGLVELGLAVCVAEGLAGGLEAAFQITDAGRDHLGLAGKVFA